MKLKLDGLTETEENRIMNDLQTQIKDDQTDKRGNQRTTDILSKRRECIVLEIEVDSSIFESSLSLQEELSSLLRKILSTAKVDTMDERSIFLTLMFDSPITPEQRNAIMGILGDSETHLTDFVSQEQHSDHNDLSSPEQSHHEEVKIGTEDECSEPDKIDELVNMQKIEDKTPEVAKVEERSFVQEEIKEETSVSCKGGKVLILTEGNVRPDIKKLSRKISETFNFEQMMHEGRFPSEKDFVAFEGSLVIITDDILSRVVDYLNKLHWEWRHPVIVLGESKYKRFSRRDLTAKNCLILCGSDNPDQKSFFDILYEELEDFKTEKKCFSQVAFDACRNFELQKDNAGDEGRSVFITSTLNEGQMF